MGRSTDDSTLLDLVRIYVNDHRAGATAGHALARRCASSNTTNEVGRWLAAEFVPALEAETRYVEAVRASLGLAADPVKQLVGRFAEVAGRLKLNGRLTGYSPLSRVEELELLVGAVNAKRQMWATFDVIGWAEFSNEAGNPTEQSASARDQLDELRRLHRLAVTWMAGG